MNQQEAKALSLNHAAVNKKSPVRFSWNTNQAYFFSINTETGEKDKLYTENLTEFEAWAMAKITKITGKTKVEVTLYDGSTCEATQGDTLYYVNQSYSYIAKARITEIDSKTDVLILEFDFIAGSKKSFLAAPAKLKTVLDDRTFHLVFKDEKEARDFAVEKNEKLIKERQDILSDMKSVTFLLESEGK